MSRSWDETDGSGADDRVDARWTEVASFPSRSLAGFVAAALGEAGLRTRVVADDGGGVLPSLDALTGGVHLQVPSEDVEGARERLAGLEAFAPPELTEPRTRVVSWRAVATALLVVALAIAVGGAFIPGTPREPPTQPQDTVAPSS